MALNASQIQSVLRQAGWPESQIVTMTAIGLAESSGNPNAINDGSGTRSVEYSVGLFQINTRAHGTRYGTIPQLKDPLTNARAALAIYKMQGLRAWGAYTDGRYRKYLPAAQAAYGQTPTLYAGASNAVNNATQAAANFINDDDFGGVAVAALFGVVLLLLLRR